MASGKITAASLDDATVWKGVHTFEEGKPPETIRVIQAGTLNRLKALIGQEATKKAGLGRYPFNDGPPAVHP